MDCIVHGVAKSRMQLSDFNKKKKKWGASYLQLILKQFRKKYTYLFESVCVCVCIHKEKEKERIKQDLENLGDK